MSTIRLKGEISLCWYGFLYLTAATSTQKTNRNVDVTRQALQSVLLHEGIW